ncbi:glucosamine-6-phosphate deaminase [Virgibacillus dakarensis]|uniref:Glucosamine-6-phosphate deaminase n=1 Tax=Lentibacillus populi TaxID=1827502 RepID=A0A9W5U0S6_9BACI|nr:glucosamine-6-phosphate deaminase [Lentibacillus populi]MBT2216089.1 glucosamine-6-phosphate deaminase [Virgibacillus dakarensis]MTW86395.1 glucosamine-6-phosphate deaminase [Virgibacillus dakarensis]GGB55237.1 glucosamine-6-phosphate deaminase 1 [Lentibacillus populi]
MKIIKVPDYQAMSEKACELVMEKVNTIEKPVLGLATGSTPEGLYQQLIKKHHHHEVSFKNTTTFNLDEYVGLSKQDPNSYYYYMQEKLFKHIDIPREQAHLPNGEGDNLQANCQDYEQLIKAAGNIDIQLLGIGLNGHIGFNEPGTSFSSRTHIVELDESTRKANARFFSSLADVPSKAVTMGIGTIMESKQIILLVSGEKKSDAVTRLITGEITEAFPASILQKHENVVLIADEAALKDR